MNLARASTRTREFSSLLATRSEASGSGTVFAVSAGAAWRQAEQKRIEASSAMRRDIDIGAPFSERSPHPAGPDGGARRGDLSTGASRESDRETAYGLSKEEGMGPGPTLVVGCSVTGAGRRAKRRDPTRRSPSRRHHSRAAWRGLTDLDWELRAEGLARVLRELSAWARRENGIAGAATSATATSSSTGSSCALPSAAAATCARTGPLSTTSSGSRGWARASGSFASTSTRWSARRPRRSSG